MAKPQAFSGLLPFVTSRGPGCHNVLPHLQCAPTCGWETDNRLSKPSSANREQWHSGVLPTPQSAPVGGGE